MACPPANMGGCAPVVARPRGRRSWWRWLAPAVLTAAVVLGVAAPASAHAALVSSEPAQRWCTRATRTRATPPCCACSRSRSGRPVTTRRQRGRCATGSRQEPERPAPHRTAARIYEDLGSLSQAIDATLRETALAAGDASAWGASAGCGCAPSIVREPALETARALGASEQGLLDLALVAHLMGDVGAEVTACEQATRLARMRPGRSRQGKS